MLWLFETVALLVYIILSAETLRAIEQAGPDVLLLFAIIFLVPLIMAFLSLTLKDKANRWTNIIVGIGFTVFMLGGLIEDLAKPYAYKILFNLSLVVAVALIVRIAWKSKQKA